MPGTLAQQVRHARPSDAARMAELLTGLGYPVSGERLRRRLQLIAGERAGRVFVAEGPDGVCGLAAMHVMRLLDRDEPVCRLTALAVAAEARRRGVASALLARVEREARARGCLLVEVTSADHRADAHEFYERAGFQDRSRRFALELLG